MWLPMLELLKISDNISKGYRHLEYGFRGAAADEEFDDLETTVEGEFDAWAVAKFNPTFQSISGKIVGGFVDYFNELTRYT